MFPDIFPPIKDRTTKELLSIYGAPGEWREDVLHQAEMELIARRVDQKKLDHARYLFKRKGQLESLKKANESFHVCDFIFDPIPSILEVLFNWELKKDGYLKKARQQKKIVIAILIATLFILLFAFLSSG